MSKLRKSSREKENLMHHILSEISSFISWLKPLNLCWDPFQILLLTWDSGPWVWLTPNLQQYSLSRFLKWLLLHKVPQAASYCSSYSLCSSHSPSACSCAWTPSSVSYTPWDSIGLSSRISSSRALATASRPSLSRQSSLKRWKESDNDMIVHV